MVVVYGHVIETIDDTRLEGLELGEERLDFGWEQVIDPLHARVRVGDTYFSHHHT